MPVSNKFIALGGIAAGMGQALQHKKDQEHQEEMAHTQMITNLVSQGLASGSITDPDAAFQFLLSGGKGKKGGKGSEIPPPIQTLIQGAQSAAGGGGGGGTSQGSVGPAGPGDPAAAGIASSTMPPPQTPPPGAGAGAQGFRFLSPQERDYRAIGLKGAEAEATTQATYGAKINLARRMFADGMTKTMDEAFERVGLKEPRQRSFAPRPVGRPVSVNEVPEGALTAAGLPVDRTAKFFQPVILSYADGSFETRFEPSSQAPVGAGAVGTDPARFRTKVTALAAAHPDWSPEQVRTQAGKDIESEDAAKAQGVSYTNQSKGEAAGVLPGIYDKIAPVALDPATNQPTPESRKAFEDSIVALPHGPSLLPLIKQAAEYDFDPNAITSRQIGGLNRAEFESLVQRYDPTYSPAKYPQIQQLKLDWQPKGRSGQAMVSAKTVISHMNELGKASAALNKFQTDKAGGITNWATTNWERLMGNKEAQDALRRYQTASKAVSDELKRLFTVTGSGSQKEADDWLALANPYGTPTEKASFVREAGQLMKGRVTPLVENYVSTVGKPPKPGQYFSSGDYTRLQALGVDTSDLTGSGPAPPAQAPPEALRAGPRKKITLPNGDIWITDDQGVPHLKPKG